VADIPHEELWRTHERRRERLVAFARRRLVRQLEERGAPPAEIDEAREALDPDVLTIGFARRFATYKRATLLLRDPERFREILCSDRPVQFIFAGKAHPHDNEGKQFIRDIVHFARTTGCRNRIVFLEDYDMVIARYLVQGVDVWMNTPRRPMEASGTSGMKATMNGAINLSVMDGWWAEAYRLELGWAIGRGEDYADEGLQDYIESNAVYDLLEKNIIPLFYDRGSDALPRNWIIRMKIALRDLCPVYSTARMVQDYAGRFYHPALQQHRLFSENGMERGRAYAEWKARLDEHWGEIDSGDITTVTSGEVRVRDALHVEAEVFLGDNLTPDDVAVQVYEGLLDRQGQIDRGQAHVMERTGDGYSGRGWHHYEASFVTESTGRHGYTVRVIPRHPDMQKTLHLGLITWA
jgi:starch phosphorylase